MKRYNFIAIVDIGDSINISTGLSIGVSAYIIGIPGADNIVTGLGINIVYGQVQNNNAVAAMHISQGISVSAALRIGIAANMIGIAEAKKIIARNRIETVNSKV